MFSDKLFIFNDEVLYCHCKYYLNSKFSLATYSLNHKMKMNSLIIISIFVSLAAAKYEIYLDRVECSKNNSYLELNSLRVRKYNRSV